MERRGISTAVIEGVLRVPGQVLEARKGRKVFQSMVSFPPESKEYLVRVFVDVDRNPAEVVTAYRTSHVEKYWREP
ncbi:MAG: DUF4258 domain-containing protein [Nitrospinae bacterium]|nr:DUF4258 domain-containing protein [Nitrospinota bacterium]